MKRTFAWLLLCAVLSGCGFKDIDKRFFVVAAGIDWSGDSNMPYRVTLRLAIPHSKVETGESHTEVESIDAPSIAEAVRKLKSHVDKEFDFGHCRVFLLGKSLAEHGIREPVDWLARRRDIQLISYVGIGEPDAATVLRAKPKSERYPGNAFFLSFGKEGTESSFTVTEMLFDTSRRLHEPGLDPYFPIVQFDGDSYQINRLALLDKKGLRLQLNPEETQLYNITANQFANSGVAISYHGRRLVLFVTKVNVTRAIEWGETPTVSLNLKLSGTVEESPVPLLDSRLHDAERQIARRLSDETETLLYKLRDAGVDPYGFGLQFMASRFGRSKQWEQWKSAFSHLRFQVHATVKIDGTGLVR